MDKKQKRALYDSLNYKFNKEYFRARNRKWMRECREQYLFTAVKNRCKKNNIPFDIELSDIVIPEICPFLNVPLTRVDGRFKYNPSIDRIDPSKGYVKGNIQIISDLANRMKQDASPEELVLFAKGVLDRYKEKC